MVCFAKKASNCQFKIYNVTLVFTLLVRVIYYDVTNRFMRIVFQHTFYVLILVYIISCSMYYTAGYSNYNTMYPTFHTIFNN